MTVTEFLHGRVPFLAGLTRDDAHYLASRAEQVPLGAGQVLALERAKLAGLYVVASGRVRARRSARDRPGLRELRPGDVFGERTFLGSAEAAATYTAAEPSLVFIVPVAALRPVLVRYPELEARAQPSTPEQRAALESFARNFEIVRLIGRGGMGSVYEAKDTLLGRTVAIKRMCPELRDDAAAAERFLREARIMASLRHPNIVEIHSILEADREVLLVLEFVDGRTLEDMVDAASRLEPAACLRVVRQAGAALEFAHSRRVVHRDFKPSNVMVASNGVAKVMDFGVARVAKDSVSRQTHSGIFGTLAYMAPEQHLGRGGPAVDVYALAVSLYHILSGVRPFLGPDYLAQKMNSDYVPLGELVPALGTAFDGFMARALEPDPGRRCPDARTFLDGLEEAMCGLARR